MTTTETTVIEETKAVSDDIYKEAIDYCVKNGIIRNTKVGEFSPKDLVKRELLAMILYRLENTPEVPDDIVIPDVEKGRWYQRGAYYVIQNEIMKVDSDGSFGVNKNVNKNEFADILWRYAGKPESNANDDEN